MEQRKTSSRPYTVGSFGRKLELFERFIEEFTHVDEELNPEERRLELQERLTNGMEAHVARGFPRIFCKFQQQNMYYTISIYFWDYWTITHRIYHGVCMLQGRLICTGTIFT